MADIPVPTNVTLTEDGDSVFEDVYIYGNLYYDFDNDDITVKSLNITGPSNVTDLTVSGNLNVTGSNTKIGQDIVTRNLKVTGITTLSTIKDTNGSTGTAGQVLSTDGTDLEWINTSSANVGSASKVGVNLDSDSTTTMFMTFVDSTSGNEEIRVDKSLTYKPSTGSFLGIATFTNIHITAGVKDTSGDVGSSGQVLSATGVAGGGTNWINVGDIAAGTASSISVTANSANKDQYIPFINETSGTQQVRADAGLKYNPNTDTLKPGRISLADDDEIRFGNGNDLKISHTDSLSGQNDSNGDSVLAGTNWCSYIKETGTGPLVFKTDGGPSTGAFQFYDTGWRPILKLFSGSGARAALYYAGSEKLVTSNTGVTVTGTVAATAYTGDGSALTGMSTGIPTGGIILWSGAANAIPAGWLLCNGSNNTPDLRGKFVVGYNDTDNDYDVNDTGGSSSTTLSTSQLPAHTHDSGSYSAASNGDHSHTWQRQDAQNDVNYRPWPASNNDVKQTDVQTSTDGAHTHSISGTSGSTGSGSAIDNRPPYYALCYIMKT
jgi:microcystin-dependent protein